MSIIDDIIEIKLNEKIYKARLDMGAIAQIQENLKEVKENITTSEIFYLAFNTENYNVINNIITESIKRCHSDLKTEDILEDMKIYERKVIKEYVFCLIAKSLPSDNTKKKVKGLHQKIKNLMIGILRKCNIHGIRF